LSSRWCQGEEERCFTWTAKLMEQLSLCSLTLGNTSSGVPYGTSGC